MRALSPSLWELIKLLSDGRWHSGQVLGDHLSVSRAAVSKQVKQLSELNVCVESEKGKGYRFAQPLDLLCLQQIESQLPALVKQHLSPINVLPVIDSTSSFLLRKMREGQRVHGELCVAELQTSGRGRRGREWYSPFGQNLYLSIAWHFEHGVSAIEGLSLAVGVAVCRALERLGVHDVRLKWPNDLLVNDKKLGGILVELGGDAVSDCVAVIGLGLNVQMSYVDRGDIEQPWVSLKQLGYDVSRSRVTAAIIIELFMLLNDYERKGFAAYQDAWNAWNAFDGAQVSLQSAEETIIGTMCGVDSKGALLLRSSDGTLNQYIGGELSLRRSL